MNVIREANPASAGWSVLTARVMHLAAGEVLELHNDTEETLLVLVSGSVSVRGSGMADELTRESPFAEVAPVVYLPPGAPLTVYARLDSEVSTGSAPAEGRFPPRLVRPNEMVGELRGGANAARQVVHTFAPPLPAERLIAYEAWVPRGGWTGWPPHRHDGLDGSPYLEETYYYRLDNDAGFGIHRNFDRQRDLEELVRIENRSLVCVPAGYHLCAAGPSSNVWILNFLAGGTDDRNQPPLFDSGETWIADDWKGGSLRLPAVNIDPTTADVQGSERRGG